MTRLKIIKNPDNQKYEEMTAAVKANDGYCPCLLEKTDETLCMCAAFRHQSVPGLCHCKRFEKIEVEDEDNPK